jgi:hypothetical protein
MLKPKTLGAVILAALMAAPAWAAEDAPPEPSATMPMMQQGGGMMTPGAMMPMMHPMGYGPVYGQAGGNHHGMGHMMMYPQMMGGGMGNMMINPHMMQMRMQHMHNVEQRLKNIEALLQQLVDQGKSG